MTTRSPRSPIPLVLAMLLAGLAALPARASGDYDTDDFVARSRTEIRLDRYVQGQLGLVLSSYSRPMLYTAWRAIASADARRPLVPLAGESLNLACCDAGGMPTQWDTQKHPPIAAWLAARDALGAQVVTAGGPRWAPGSLRAVDGDSYNEFLNCPDGAYAFAVETLGRLRQRPDATPARLRDWVDAQDQVFAQCSYSPSGQPGQPKPAVVTPPPDVGPLPEAESPYWRQARQYQRAASAFYAGRWTAAHERFAAIATDDGHPWQSWAALARMRTLVRQATLAPRAQDDHGPQKLPADLLDRLQPLAARIATHPDWRVQQQAADNLMNLVRARAEPDRRLTQLTRELAALDKEPARQSLADWARIADHRLDAGPEKEQERLRAALRKLPVFDWILNMQGCKALPDAPDGMARWKAQPDSVLWLVPALSCGDGAVLAKDASTWQALQRAADRVPATHPAWMTVRYQQVRLLREAGEFDRARAQLAPLLTPPAGPTPSARNLIAAEALALARTPPETLSWLSREYGAWSRYRGSDVPYPYDFPAPKERSLANDGAAVLAQRFTLAEWQAAVESPAVAAGVRLQLAFGLWWRADLLGQTDTARRAATTLARLLPPADAEAATSPYLKATTAAQRRGALWRASLLRPGLSAQLATGLGLSAFNADSATTDPKEAVAGTWCRLDRANAWQIANPEGAIDVEPVPGAVSGWPAPDAVAKERAALRAAGSATGAFARWVLAESRRPDRPADLDWLLYVGIQSTRGGCVDADNSASSKAMYMALHKLYPKSPWAAKAKVWY